MKNRMRPIQVVRLALAVAGLSLGLTLRADGAPAARPVFVTASFRDNSGLFIGNLEMSEVQVSEDGQPRSIQFMARDELPTVYGILFDLSVVSDVPDERRSSFLRPTAGTTLRDLAYGLIDRHLGRQYVWAAAYEQQVTVLQEATSDGFRVKDAIQRLRGRRNPDESFLFNALASATEKMSTRQERRRVLLVFIGLTDSATAGRTKVLKNLLSASNIEVFFFSSAFKLDSTGGVAWSLSESLLRELAATTAGESFFIRPGAEHPGDVLTRVVNHVSTFYTIGFDSTSTVEKPARLVIKCSRPGSKVRHHPESPVFS